MTPLAWRWYFWGYCRGDTRKKAENQYQEIIKELALFWHFWQRIRRMHMRDIFSKVRNLF